MGPRTPFSPERPVEVRNYVEDSLTYPEWDELADQLVDTETMAPGIDDSSNRGSATLQDPCLSMQPRHSCRASLHVISTTVMLCSVASQTVCSGAYSLCRTRQRDLSPALVDVTTSHQC